MRELSVVKKFIVRTWVIFCLVNLIPITIYSSVVLFPSADWIFVIGCGLFFTVCFTIPLFVIIYCFIEELSKKFKTWLRFLIFLATVGFFYFIASFMFFVSLLNMTTDPLKYLTLLKLLSVSFFISALANYRTINKIIKGK